MKKCVEKCLNQLIVSCQAYQDTPLYGADNIKKLVECAKLGGASVVRCCWPQDIKAAKEVENITIIGINKIFAPNGDKNDIFITPTFEAAKEIIEAGADLIALDARITKKRGKEELKNLLAKIHSNFPEIGIMADCETFEEGKFVAETGYVDIIATTLSGLNKNLNHPDYHLVKKFKNELNLPVNAEGHVWELYDLDLLYAANADMITIGTAITRPHEITKRFIDYYNNIKY